MKSLIKKYESRIETCNKEIKEYKKKDTFGIFYSGQVFILEKFIKCYEEIINDLKQLNNGK